MNKKVLFTRFLVIFLFIAITVSGIFTAKLLSSERLGNSELDNIASNEIVNVLIMGLDGGPRTDTLMIVSLNNKTQKINILSIPRDTRVQINGKFDKINHAMGYKDHEKASIRAVKNLTGLPIHYYAVISNKVFREIVDVFDGVDIDVQQNMDYDDGSQDLHIHLKKGYQHLDGAKAEQFVRFRRYPMGDIARTEVQQKFVKEFIKQKLKIEYINKLPQLFGTLKENVKTNITLMDITKYVGVLKKISANTSGNINTFEVPGNFETINHICYYRYNAEELKEMIQKNFV